MLSLCAILALGVVPAFPELKIIFLDVGQGDCILVQCPGSGKYILIDCGTTKTHDNNKSKAIKTFLKENKAKIKSVVVTHGDTDHYRIISSLLKKKGLEPETIIVGGLASDYTAKHGENEACGEDKNTPCDSLPTKKGEKSPAKATQGETFFSRLEALNKKKQVNDGKLSILPPNRPPRMTVPKGAWLLGPNFREAELDSIVSCSSKDSPEGNMRFQVLSANYPPPNWRLPTT